MRFFVRLLILLLLLPAAARTAAAGWTRLETNTLGWLRAIHFSDERTGWIGGARGVLLKTNDGGDTWRPAPRPTRDTILEIHFTDPRSGWMLCERDIYALGGRAPSYLLKTDDGGDSWERIEFEPARKRRVTGIFFTDKGFGLAVGETGTLYGLEDDDRTWRRMAPPGGHLLLDGTFTDDLHGAVVGGGGTIFFTEDGGTSWEAGLVDDRTRVKLNSVFFLDRRHGWAAGSKGRIYQTINGGKYWRRQDTGVDASIADVFFRNTAEGWAVGEGGMLLHSRTAGNVWEKVSTGTEHRLEKVLFRGDRGWIIGFGGTLLAYRPDDGGAKKDHPRLKKR